MSNLRPIRPSNLRAAPADLTPLRVDRLLALLSAADVIPLDASIAASGRTRGEVRAPLVAVEEAGRDIAPELSA